MDISTFDRQASATAWSVKGARLAFLERVRGTGRDDLGQPVVRFVSPRGGEPLRDQLRRAAPGETVLLGSYALFDEPGPFREFGPVYISAELDASSPLGEDLFASDYFGSDLVLRKYDRRYWIAAARRIGKRDAAGLVGEWLTEGETAFVDARFADYGCFACRFVRLTDVLRREAAITF